MKCQPLNSINGDYRNLCGGCLLLAPGLLGIWGWCWLLYLYPHQIPSADFLAYPRLKDGSKYLLRAPTEPLMQEWITKLQQNSGKTEVIIRKRPWGHWRFKGRRYGYHSGTRGNLRPPADHSGGLHEWEAHMGTLGFPSSSLLREAAMPCHVFGNWFYICARLYISHISHCNWVRPEFRRGIRLWHREGP